MAFVSSWVNDELIIGPMTLASGANGPSNGANVVLIEFSSDVTIGVTCAAVTARVVGVSMSSLCISSMTGADSKLDEDSWPIMLSA